MPPMREPRKPPTPWLFSLLILPLGIVVVGSKPLNLDAVATKLGDFLTKTGEDNPCVFGKPAEPMVQKRKSEQ
jgi:hypothetical protein